MRNCRRISGSLATAAIWSLACRIGTAGAPSISTPASTSFETPAFEQMHGSIADMNVVANANLPGHDDVIAGRGAAGDADLRANEVVSTETAVVGDHHQVVDLRPFADHRRAVGAAVDRRRGADFDVGGDFDIAKLGRQQMSPVDLTVAESVSADDGAGMDHDAVADVGIFVEDGVRENGDAGADGAARHDADAGVNRRVGADVDVVADRGAGMDFDVRRQLGG